MAGVYWVGSNGHVYVKAAGTTGVQDWGTGGAGNASVMGYSAIADPNMTQLADAPDLATSMATGFYDAGGTYNDMGPISGVSAGPTAAEIQTAKDIAERAALRGDIKGKNGDLSKALKEFFDQLDAVGKDRVGKLETQYGDQLNKITGEYTEAIPMIENSFASIGAGDSTDRRDGKLKAKSGYEEGVKTVGVNKNADLAKVGEYIGGEKVKFGEMQNKANRLAERADSVEDIGELRSYRNNLEDTTGEVNVAKGSINTETGAINTLNAITQDGGRFDQVQNAVTGILGSSMAGDTKAAALTALSEKSGLTDAQKAEIDKQKETVYGDAYAAQAVA